MMRLPVLEKQNELFHEPDLAEGDHTYTDSFERNPVNYAINLGGEETATTHTSAEEGSVVELKYVDRESREKLRPYAEPALSRLREHLDKELGLPFYTSDTSMEVSSLPTYVLAGEGGVKIFKVFGRYDTRTGRITIDPVVVEKDSGLRKLLEEHGLEIPSANEVITHEMVHAAQDGLGIIDDAYANLGHQDAREFIEGSAQNTTNTITGEESHVYRESAKAHRERARARGYRRAFLNPVL